MKDRLVMTPQLQWAVTLLSMPLGDLLLEIERARSQNPLLSTQLRTTRPIGPFPPDLEALPEVYVFSRDGALVVEPNVNAVPDMFVGNVLVPSADADPSVTDEILARFTGDDRDRARAALWIVRAVEQRARTYVKIVSAIAEGAPDWFRDETAPAPRARPREVAEAVGMHASTIERVLGGEKVLRSERGLVRFDALLR